MSGFLLDQDQVARVDIVEQRARPLVEHVGIEPLGLEQRDPALPQVALGVGLVELAG